MNERDMRTKILYILTSEPTDIYLEQTFLSIYSLRQHERDAHVILLTDNRTVETLVGKRTEILKIVDEKIVIPFDASISNMKRSRWLKTRMRSMIDGDFLYIDGDTIVNAPLNEIDECSLSIGSVEDAHRTLEHHYGKEKLLRQAHTLGFSIEKERYYFNGGVFYVKDTLETRAFFDRWHKNWERSVKYGINQDMPALIQTNIEMGHMIQRLDGVWNCQVMYGFNYFTKAKIIHYFASRYSTDNGGFLYDFMNPSLLEDIKRTGDVTEEIKKKLQEPLSCFDERVELIGGSDVDILNTHVYKLVRLIYHKHPRLFNHIQSILYKLNRLNKRKSE